MSIRRFAVSVLAALVLLGGPVLAVDAGQAERRVFDVLQDGRRIGTHVMDIRQDGDRTTVSYATRFVVELMRVPFFAYNRESQEVWEGDRLVAMDGVSRYSGKTFNISVRPEGEGLRVKGRKHDWLAPANAVPNSLWNPVLIENPPVFDAERGKELRSQAHFMGTETLTIGGNPVAADHYLVTGFKEPVELWYSAENELLKARLKLHGYEFVYKLRG